VTVSQGRVPWQILANCHVVAQPHGPVGVNAMNPNMSVMFVAVLRWGSQAHHQPAQSGSNAAQLDGMIAANLLHPGFYRRKTMADEKPDLSPLESATEC